VTGWLPALALVAAAACANPSPPAPTTAPAAAATAAPPAAPSLTSIHATYSNLVATELPVWLAQDQGIFAKHGLDVDLRLADSGAGMPALLAGEVQMGLADLPILLPHLRAGTLRALAIGSAERYPLLPDVPTMAEAGLPGVMTDNWHGLVAPIRTPPAALAALQKAAATALTEPETARLLREQGAIPVGNGAEEFATFIRSEQARWAEVIRRAGVKLD
jgi:hypothetical protein